MKQASEQILVKVHQRIELKVVMAHKLGQTVLAINSLFLPVPKLMKIDNGLLTHFGHSFAHFGHRRLFTKKQAPIGAFTNQKPKIGYCTGDPRGRPHRSSIRGL